MATAPLPLTSTARESPQLATKSSRFEAFSSATTCSSHPRAMQRVRNSSPLFPKGENGQNGLPRTNDSRGVAISDHICNMKKSARGPSLRSSLFGCTPAALGALKRLHNSLEEDQVWTVFCSPYSCVYMYMCIYIYICGILAVGRRQCGALDQLS